MRVLLVGFFRQPALIYRQLLVLGPAAPVPAGFRPDLDVDVTSRSTTLGRQLSPFLLGPVPVADGPAAASIENLWQFSKCYEDHWDTERGCPTAEWWAWRNAGFADAKAHRYPMGKGARPVCSWWEGEALDTVRARQTIYRPNYLHCATETGAWRWLLRELRRGKRVLLRDFGAFDHVLAGVTFEQALSLPTQQFAHGVILAAELERRLASD